MKTIAKLSLPLCCSMCLMPFSPPPPRSRISQRFTLRISLSSFQLEQVSAELCGPGTRRVTLSGISRLLTLCCSKNDKPRSISALREEEVPISAVIAVDTSWSIGSFLTNAVTAAVDFFNGLEAEDPAVVLFSEKPRVLLDWGEKRDDLEQELNSVETDGKTALYDSVIWIAEKPLRRSIGQESDHPGNGRNRHSQSGNLQRDDEVDSPDRGDPLRNHLYESAHPDLPGEDPPPALFPSWARSVMTSADSSSLRISLWSKSFVMEGEPFSRRPLLTYMEFMAILSAKCEVVTSCCTDLIQIKMRPARSESGPRESQAAYSSM